MGNSRFALGGTIIADSKMDICVLTIYIPF